MTATKAAVRAQLLAARRHVDPELHTAEAALLATHLCGLVTGPATVCAYVPVGSEPGSIDMLDGLRTAGARVLLPVTAADDIGAPKPLRWAEYQPGALVQARFGLLEPATAPLPPTAIAAAAVLIIPALAVDRHGVRLGRGAGFYDRSLPYRDPAAMLVAVVRDDELVAELPAEPHDIAMTHAVTPAGGVVALG